MTAPTLVLCSQITLPLKKSFNSALKWNSARKQKDEVRRQPKGKSGGWGSEAHVCSQKGKKRQSEH